MVQEQERTESAFVRQIFIGHPTTPTTQMANQQAIVQGLIELTGHDPQTI